MKLLEKIKIGYEKNTNKNCFNITDFIEVSDSVVTFKGKIEHPLSGYNNRFQECDLDVNITENTDLSITCTGTIKTIEGPVYNDGQDKMYHLAITEDNTLDGEDNSIEFFMETFEEFAQ